MKDLGTEMQIYENIYSTICKSTEKGKELGE